MKGNTKIDQFCIACKYILPKVILSFSLYIFLLEVRGWMTDNYSRSLPLQLSQNCRRNSIFSAISLLVLFSRCNTATLSFLCSFLARMKRLRSSTQGYLMPGITKYSTPYTNNTGYSNVVILTMILPNSPAPP